ncbi:MAG: DUF2723 domain-containing protein [bacterium]|nr:DUF2723 domain-containing protein [bacterium]
MRSTELEPETRPGLPLVIASIVLVVTLTIYSRTLLPGVGFWDTGEFQTVPHVLGIAHPTGYPLYILLGKLFSFVPVGSMAYRMNLFSAVCAALAATGLGIVALKLRIRPALACTTALCFALAANTWNTANRADPHTLHAAIVIGLWWLALRYVESGHRAWFWALALGSGLGLCNHMSLTMELPAIALYTFLSRPDGYRRPGTLAVSGLMGAIGLSLYAYLPLRALMNPPMNYANPVTWERFRFVALGEQFRGDMGFMSWHGVATALARWPEVMGWYADWFTVWGRNALGVLAAGGLILIWRRNWRLGVSLVLGIAIPFYAASTYANADLPRYFLAPNLLLLLGAATGLQAMFPVRLSGALSLLTLVLPASLALTHWSQVDRHLDHSAEIYERNVFDAVKPRAVILSWWSFTTPLWYGQHVEGRRPDVTLVDEIDIYSQDLGNVVKAVDTFFPARPVYIIHMHDNVERIAQSYTLRKLPPVTPYNQDVYEVTGRTPPSGGPVP